MLSREKITKKLDGIDSRLCVAFATRCVLRVLPLLVDNDDKEEVFWGWNQEGRSKQLLAILTAQQVSLNISAFGKNASSVYANVGTNSYVDAVESQSETFAHTSKAYVAAHAVAFASTSAYAYAVQAVYKRIAIVDAAYTATKIAKLYRLDIETVVLGDLDMLKQMNRNGVSLFRKKVQVSSTDFLYSPLWANSASKEWECQHQRFCEAVLALDEGFDVWLDWYEDRLNGEPLDFELESKWLNIPEGIKVQGARSTNAYLSALTK